MLPLPSFRLSPVLQLWPQRPYRPMLRPTALNLCLFSRCRPQTSLPLSRLSFRRLTLLHPTTSLQQCHAYFPLLPASLLLCLKLPNANRLIFLLYPTQTLRSTHLRDRACWHSARVLLHRTLRSPRRSPIRGACHSTTRYQGLLSVFLAAARWQVPPCSKAPT